MGKREKGSKIENKRKKVASQKSKNKNKKMTNELRQYISEQNQILKDRKFDKALFNLMIAFISLEATWLSIQTIIKHIWMILK